MSRRAVTTVSLENSRRSAPPAADARIDLPAAPEARREWPRRSKRRATIRTSRPLPIGPRRNCRLARSPTRRGPRRAPQAFDRDAIPAHGTVADRSPPAPEFTPFCRSDRPASPNARSTRRVTAPLHGVTRPGATPPHRFLSLYDRMIFVVDNLLAMTHDTHHPGRGASPRVGLPTNPAPHLIGDRHCQPKSSGRQTDAPTASTSRH